VPAAPPGCASQLRLLAAFPLRCHIPLHALKPSMLCRQVRLQAGRGHHLHLCERQLVSIRESDRGTPPPPMVCFTLRCPTLACPALAWPDLSCSAASALPSPARCACPAASDRLLPRAHCPCTYTDCPVPLRGCGCSNPGWVGPFNNYDGSPCELLLWTCPLGVDSCSGLLALHNPCPDK